MDIRQVDRFTFRSVVGYRFEHEEGDVSLEAVVNDKPVAALSAYKDDNFLVVMVIEALPAFRRRGLATALIREAQRLAGAAHVRMVDPSPSGQKLGEALGLVFCEEDEDQDGAPTMTPTPTL